MPIHCEGRRVNDTLEYPDDDAAGFVLRIIRGNDGDFHVSFAPDRERLARADRAFAHVGEHVGTEFPWFRVNVRVCTHAGGGRHARLYAALATLWREEGMYE